MRSDVTAGELPSGRAGPAAMLAPRRSRSPGEQAVVDFTGYWQRHIVG
jgi:hypothetical protein